MKKLKAPVRCSSLGLVMSCSGSHGLLAKLRGDRVESEAALMGSAYHEAMALVSNDQIINYEALQAKYALSEDAVIEIRQMVRRMPLDYADWSLTTEKELSVGEDLRPLKPGEQPLLVGHIDLLAFHSRIDGLVLLTDWKSGFLEHDDLQLLGYTILTAANYPDAQMILPQYFYSRNGRISKRVDQNGDAKPYSRQEIEALWKGKIRPRIQEAMFGKRTYTQNNRCAHCAAFSCPSWSNWRKSLLTDSRGGLVARDMSLADPSEWVRTVLPKLKVLKSALDEIEEQCKSVALTQGPVDLLDGTVYANRPTTMETVNLARSLPLLMELCGGDAERILRVYEKISKDALYELAKSLFADDRGRMPKGKMKDLTEALDSLGAIDRALKNRVSTYAKENIVEEDAE